LWTDYFNVDVIRTLDGALAAEVDQLPLFERKPCSGKCAIRPSTRRTFSTSPRSFRFCSSRWALSSASSAPPCAGVSLQAIFTGLATLVWLLVVTVPDEEDTKAES
jgi:hypothetical protein